MDNAGGSISRRTLLIGGAAVVVAAAVAVPVGVTLFASPGGKLVKELLKGHPFTIAHRGGSLDWPEMSLFAYQQAVSHHVDALEMSVARTSDGVWFGLHDDTLDRTSGTSGFVASDHTWAEVQKHRITARHTTDHAQSSRPYLRFDEFVTTYAETHTLFVDPKASPPEYYPELLGLMKKLAKQPTESFVAKGYGTSVAWAAAASAEGLQTWGFYYGSELSATPEMLENTSADWSLLGLDYGASDAEWETVKALGRPVIGHVIDSLAASKTARAHGAQGLMISGVTEVLG